MIKFNQSATKLNIGVQFNRHQTFKIKNDQQAIIFEKRKTLRSYGKRAKTRSKSERPPHTYIFIKINNMIKIWPLKWSLTANLDMWRWAWHEFTNKCLKID